MWPTQVPLSRNLKWWQSHHLSKSGSAPAAIGTLAAGGPCRLRNQARPSALVGGQGMGRACCLPRPWRRARVVAGGLRRQARNPQGPGSQAHVVGGWSVVVGGLPPASLCACPAAARPGAVPLKGVRGLLLPGLSCPPAPGLWRSFRAGQRVGCPPWFMPWFCSLPGWLARSLGLAFVRVSWPAAPPGPLLRGCVVVLRLRCRWVGAGAQARKGGFCREPAEQAAL